VTELLAEFSLSAYTTDTPLSRFARIPQDSANLQPVREVSINELLQSHYVIVEQLFQTLHKLNIFDFRIEMAF
jgi:hypothetical protein